MNHIYSFEKPLTKGVFLRRYKRFFVDVALEDGSIVTAHCPNSGAMVGVLKEGSEVWLEHNDSPKRALKYTWHMIKIDNQIIGVNTHLPNKIVGTMLRQKMIPQLDVWNSVRGEVKYGKNSRIDFLLQEKDFSDAYVEVKNVHLSQEGVALFPDCVTSRGAKHLFELSQMVEQGAKAFVIYVVQRDDVSSCRAAFEYDKVYAKAAEDAKKAGVVFKALSFCVKPEGISFAKELEMLT